MENLLKNIVKVRKEKGLSYESLAQELNLSPTAYRKIEIGKTQLTVERLYEIAQALQVKVAQLLDIQGESYRQTNTENATVYSQKIENFYQENKETCEKLIASLHETITAKDALIATQQDTIALLKSQM